jgi:hypothetical protein
VALLDFHLRGGERSDGLIAQLRRRDVTGYHAYHII